MKEYNIGTNIRDRRKLLGKNQKEIALEMGVSKSQISKWETETSYPSMSNFVKLSHALNIRPEALIEGRIEENLIENKEYKEKGQKILIVILCVLVSILCLRFIGDVYLKFSFFHTNEKYKKEILYRHQQEDDTWEIRQMIKSNDGAVWVDVVTYQNGDVITDGKVLEVIAIRDIEVEAYSIRLEEDLNKMYILIQYDEEGIIKDVVIEIEGCDVD